MSVFSPSTATIVISNTLSGTLPCTPLVRPCPSAYLHHPVPPSTLPPSPSIVATSTPRYKGCYPLEPYHPATLDPHLQLAFRTFALRIFNLPSAPSPSASSTCLPRLQLAFRVFNLPSTSSTCLPCLQLAFRTFALHVFNLPCAPSPCVSSTCFAHLQLMS
ncbi:hypothetical protein M422DRAFT_267554 [Sphaerobolus stellatus SS14]|uniref:Uncharacterized protein n=1 Tax=Sphaerobolus stellatus (strain SS14) TaxID=990650 RepID=A0A0C9V0A5_SPHS4|nr:hypothetical protein M422DRAFT_267554 [Sphaerobolus stellatus SS14]